VNIIIAGGTGLIGTELIKELIYRGHKIVVLSRNSDKKAVDEKFKIVKWDGTTTSGWAHLVDDSDAIINLAGENLGTGRWTPDKKKRMYSSRISAGNAIYEAVNVAKKKKRVILQASAVGYYGNVQNETLNENSPPGNDFLARLCIDWENSLKDIEKLNVRKIIMRIGLVLTPHGGALKQLLLPYKLFAGGPLGNGEQWWPWIHITDVITSMCFLLENEDAIGVYNLTAPDPVKMKDFGRALGKVLKRPHWISIPSVFLNILLGEMSMIVLTGQRVIPDNLIKSGYEYQFGSLDSALQDLLIG